MESRFSKPQSKVPQKGAEHETHQQNSSSRVQGFEEPSISKDASASDLGGSSKQSVPATDTAVNTAIFQTGEMVHLLLMSTVETINEELPFFDTKFLLHYLRQPEVIQTRVDISHQAMVNALIASATLSKAMNCSFQEVATFSWSYFKTALGSFSGITLQSTHVRNVQALVAAVMFANSSADTNMTAMLVSVAARNAQILGLQSELMWDRGLDPTERGIRRKLFWTIHVLETELSIWTGIAPVISEDDIETDMISDDPKQPEYDWGFRARITLSRILLNIRNQLYSSSSTKQPVSELLTQAQELERKLNDWRSTSGVGIFPDDGDNGGELTTARVFLLLSYHNCISMVQWSIYRNITKMGVQDTHLRFAYQLPCCKMAVSKVRAAARSTIATLQGLPVQQFSDIW